MCACVYVPICVRVCTCEGERKSEKEKGVAERYDRYNVKQPLISFSFYGDTGYPNTPYCRNRGRQSRTGYGWGSINRGGRFQHRAKLQWKLKRTFYTIWNLCLQFFPIRFDTIRHTSNWSSLKYITFYTDLRIKTTNELIRIFGTLWRIKMHSYTFLSIKDISDLSSHLNMLSTNPNKTVDVFYSKQLKRSNWERKMIGDFDVTCLW